MQRLLLILLPIIYALLFFAPFLSEDRLFLGAHTDAISGWKESASKVAADRAQAEVNWQMTDALYVFHPEAHFSDDAVRRGLLPTWNPYVLGGLPHIATGTPAVYYPFGWIAYIIPSPGHYAIAACLQAALAGILMGFFLRGRGLGIASSSLGSFLFVFSGWMSSHMLYHQITGSAVWLPLMLMGIDFISKNQARKGIASLAVALAASFFAGFPQVTLISLLVTGIYALFRLTLTRPRPLVLASLGVLLGIVLAAAQLVPSFAFTFSNYTNRPLPNYEVLESLSLEPEALATVSIPDLFGHPEWEKSLESPLWRRSLLAGARLEDGSNYTEIQLYVGWLALLLVVFSFRSGHRRLNIAGLACVILGVAAALGTPFLRVISTLPGMTVGDPKRYLFVVGFGLSLLAASGLDGLIRGVEKRWIKTAVVVAGLLGLLALGGSIYLSEMPADSFRESMAEVFAHGKVGERFNASAQDVMEFIPSSDFESNRAYLVSCGLRAAIGLGVGALLLMGFLTRFRKTSVLLCSIWIVLDLTSQGRSITDWNPIRTLIPGANRPITKEGFYRPTAVTDFLQSVNATEDPFRIIRFGQENFYTPRTLQPLKIEDAQGYAALYLQRYRLLQDALESAAPGEPSRTQETAVKSIKRLETLESPVLDLLGVRFVITQDELDSKSTILRTMDESGRVYENPRALPRAWVVPKAMVGTQSEVFEVCRGLEFDPRKEVWLDDGGDTKPPNPTKAFPDTEAPDNKATVRWLSRDFDRIELEVESSGGYLVISDGYLPGWEATIDGEPCDIYPAYLAFRAVEVPEGKHRIAMEFRGQPERLGAALSLIGLLICLALPFCRTSFRRFKGRGSESAAPKAIVGAEP